VSDGDDSKDFSAIMREVKFTGSRRICIILLSDLGLWTSRLSHDAVASDQLDVLCPMPAFCALAMTI
jgi:hypothetical protein